MIKHSTFKPAWWLGNSHLQTIYPAFFRHSPLQLPRQRQRLQLDDGDFLDLDFYGGPARSCVLLLHGLAGNSVNLAIFLDYKPICTNRVTPVWL